MLIIEAQFGTTLAILHLLLINEMKRMKLFGLVIVGTFSLCTFAQEKYSICDKFKVGTFEIVDRKGRSEMIVSRSGTRQIEVNKRNADTYAYEVEWLSDCQYKLTMLSTNTKKGKKGDTFIVSLFPKNFETYEYTIRSTGSKKKKSFRVKKIGNEPSKLY